MSPGEQKQNPETTIDNECKIIDNEMMVLIFKRKIGITN